MLCTLLQPLHLTGRVVDFAFSAGKEQKQHFFSPRQYGLGTRALLFIYLFIILLSTQDCILSLQGVTGGRWIPVPPRRVEVTALL